MKALTIWQPWASLIIFGAKPWEWRGWRAPRSLVGQRIVIHAGSRKPKMSEIADIIIDIKRGQSSLLASPALDFFERVSLGHLPLACGLGTATLGTPIAALDWTREHDRSGLDSDRVDHSKWAWPLTDIRSFEPVVPMRGAQGFWDWLEAVDG